MKLIMVSLMLLSVFVSNSQRTIDVSKVDESPTRGLFYVVGGQPFSIAKYTKVTEGSPFFKEEWLRGSVIIKSGEQYDNQLLRLDLIDNELHYLDSAGQEMITTEKVVEVLMKDTVSGKQYRFVHSSVIAVTEKLSSGWYQLLTMGTVSLFQKFQKEILETRPYGSATYEESIKTTSNYFIAYKNVFYRVKKIKELPNILSDKRTELNNFISSRSLSGKSESDFISLIEYYNSLQPK